MVSFSIYFTNCSKTVRNACSFSVYLYSDIQTVKDFLLILMSVEMKTS